MQGKLHKMLGTRVLVLNQDYSPIAVCSGERAFLLMYLNKAELIASLPDRQIRSITLSFSFPTVIRLNNYKNIPFKKVMLTRRNIFKRDSHFCQYCGTDKNLTLDHVIPRTKGGHSSWTNLVTACQRCNSIKGDQAPEKAGLTLKRVPFRPSYVIFLRDFSGFLAKEWKPFLMHDKVKTFV